MFNFVNDFVNFVNVARVFILNLMALACMILQQSAFYATKDLTSGGLSVDQLEQQYGTIPWADGLARVTSTSRVKVAQAPLSALLPHSSTQANDIRSACIVRLEDSPAVQKTSHLTSIIQSLVDCASAESLPQAQAIATQCQVLGHGSIGPHFL